jgi:hypothetical protein
MRGRLTGGCDGVLTTVVDSKLRDGSRRDSEPARSSAACTRERKGREKSCPWWTATTRNKGVTIALTGVDIGAVAGSDKRHYTGIL